MGIDGVPGGCGCEVYGHYRVGLGIEDWGYCGRIKGYCGFLTAGSTEIGKVLMFPASLATNEVSELEGRKVGSIEKREARLSTPL
jgi:hypothetical protein